MADTNGNIPITDCEQFDLCEVVTAVLERDGFSEFVNTVTP